MKIALVCTQGGHLTETLQLIDAFKGHEIFFATHHSPRDGDFRDIAPAYFSKGINSNPIIFLFTFPWAMWVIIREKPDVIFSIGAEIALPFFFWGKLFGIKTIYLESWCRTDSLSMTGRISYPFVDAFYVQWPQLLEVCGPKAKYFGAVV
ncbi:MAG TPA: PssD/Cps14F family polysaccharide biosynthesis glycosyltransferase [Anaerolineales bacterium]|jgi:UDP-N-acetylglucosamine:LPS N-acetylglucosamine transferase